MLAGASETQGKYLVRHIEGKTAKFIVMTLRSVPLAICFMCGDFDVSHAS
jgi:hypothetical protein